MKLRNLLHIREGDIHIIGSITPPFFFRVSEIMENFVRLCDNNSIEASLNLLKIKYSPTEFVDFQQRLEKVKDKLFVDNDYKEAQEIDISSKVHILTLNVTRKCNLKCDYCFEDSEYRKLGNMSFEIAKKAIDTFFTTPTNTPGWVIIFTGGEPLFNYDLIKKVVKYIDNKSLTVKYNIKTNATLLNDEKMDFLIKNNFKIQVSLDGNKKAHDTHRKFVNGKGTFEIVDKSIRRLIEKGYGSNVSISGTLTHQTAQYVDNSYAQFNSYPEMKSYSLKNVMSNSHCQYGFNLDDYKIVYNSNLKNNKHLLEQGKKLMEENHNIDICGVGIWNMAIDVDGKIYPCYRMCGDSKYVISDIESLKLPLKLPQNLENIYRLESNSQCSKCYLINVCKRGCYSDKLIYHYDSNKCFQSKKTIIEEIVYNELINKKTYLSLDIV